jgi:MFS family permease
MEVFMSDLEKKSNRTAMLVFIGCCMSMLFANGTIAGTKGNYSVPVANEFGTPISTISFFLTVQGIVMIFGTPIMGSLMVKKNPRVIATISAAFMAVGYLLFSVWHHPWGFYISGALIGIGSSCIIYVAVPLFMNSWFRASVGMYMGIALALSGVGQIFSNPISTYLFASVGWRSTALIIGGVAGTASVLFCALCLRNKPESYGLRPYGADSASTAAGKPVSQAAGGMNPRDIYKSSVFIPLIITTFIFGYCVSVVPTITSFVMTLEILPTAQTGLATMTLAMGMLLGKVIIGRMFDKLKMVTVVLIFSVLQCISLVLTAMIYVNASLLFPALTLLGFCIGGTGTVAIPMVTRTIFGPKYYSVYYPKFPLVNGVALAVVGFLNNYIYDVTGTYGSIYCIMAGASLLGGLIIVYVQSQQEKLRQQWEPPATTDQ